MDWGAWWVAVHGVAKSQTRLSVFTFTFHFHALEKEMATHSSVLAWRTPGTGEPGGLPSMGSHRVGHDWSDLAAAAAIMLWIVSSCSTKLWATHCDIYLNSNHLGKVRLVIPCPRGVTAGVWRCLMVYSTRHLVAPTSSSTGVSYLLIG